MVEIYTIGFTKKTAETFFGLLQNSGMTVLLDTRLKPNSQLSGFARGNDLPYLLKRLSGCEYRHVPLMAPTEELLKQYRKEKLWANYERAFCKLLDERQLIAHLDRLWWGRQRVCLLCSEHEPDFCHRRLVAEYIARHWKEVTICHLV